MPSTKPHVILSPQAKDQASPGPCTTLRAALLDARVRLASAGIESLDIEADLLLRYALSSSLSLEGEGWGEGDRPTSDQPLSVQATTSKAQQPSQNLHSRDKRTKPLPEPVKGRYRPSAADPSEPQAPTRAWLLSHLNDPLPAAAADRYEAFLARRLAHEPSAYITGHREFYGLDFLVTPAVLIPRPETETLVELAIQLVRRMSLPQQALKPARPEALVGRASPPVLQDSLVIADIGTGSGAIAIALAKHLTEAQIVATDASPAALHVARLNAARHDVTDRITFLAGDLLAPIAQPIQLLIANLPYVESNTLARLDPEVRDHEPRQALDGGSDGLDLIRRLLAQAPAHLAPGAAICLELGDTQSLAAESLARESFPNAAISLHPDLAGHPRVLIIQT